MESWHRQNLSCLFSDTTDLSGVRRTNFGVITTKLQKKKGTKKKGKGGKSAAKRAKQKEKEARLKVRMPIAAEVALRGLQPNGLFSTVISGATRAAAIASLTRKDTTCGACRRTFNKVKNVVDHIAAKAVGCRNHADLLRRLISPVAAQSSTGAPASGSASRSEPVRERASAPIGSSTSSASSSRQPAVGSRARAASAPVRSRDPAPIGSSSSSASSSRQPADGSRTTPATAPVRSRERSSSVPEAGAAPFVAPTSKAAAPAPPPAKRKAEASVGSPRSSGTPSAGDCTVCMEKAASHVLIPCGHQCCCGECAAILCTSAVPRCPVCRASVNDNLKVFAAGIVSEKRTPDAAQTSTLDLPQDAPPGHVAHERVKYSGTIKAPLASFTFERGGQKIRFQTTLAAAGSKEACLVIARACFMKFEEGLDKEAVLEFRACCYSKAKGKTPAKKKQKVAAEPVLVDDDDMPLEAFASEAF
eukprot:TRINITY_DN21035_c0_g1_i1.p1 TRINITY_DN21035_c0_g1~~TRINITY_DN21035_c0_g1_i1.p1  ORF type:complete len:475 (-),score=75.92 TRINITY_DN21035_c0_g1_i1:78-1502(-)